MEVKLNKLFKRQYHELYRINRKTGKEKHEPGSNAAEVFLETNRNLSVNVLKSEIETIEEASSQGVGFRVFVDGKMGFSHCNDFSDKSLEETISKAIAFAKLSSPDENNVLD